MENRSTYIAFIASAVLLFSCNNIQSKNHGPIVLGDSSTIVTEKDPEKLRDLVTDLQPKIKTADIKDSVEAAKKIETKPVADKPKNTTATTSVTPTPVKQVAPSVQLSGNGIKADFKVATVLIPNVTAKLSGKANLEKASGAVFSFVSGTIAGNQLQVTPGVTKVSQRYQTVIAVKNNLGTLPLESLSTTTAWQSLSGSNKIYKITGLDAKSLDYSEANRGEIRNAVAKSARKHHFSRRKTQEWEESVRNARAVNQKPCYIILRSVMWKIDGKDANGKAFSRQVRVDMPL